MVFSAWRSSALVARLKHLLDFFSQLLVNSWGLSPHRKRWQTLSGEKAKLDGDGRTFEAIGEERRKGAA
jgi:hypothetical protein